jgi:hypothetical protein
MSASPDDKCSATNRRGKRCGRPVVPGLAVCRYHGGLSPRGPAHPSFKHGRYSKALLHRHALASAYEAAEADNQLLSIRAETALLQARAVELAERLGNGESGDRWAKLLAAWREFQAAGRAKDAAAAQSALTTIGQLIESAGDDEQQWSELSRVIDKKSVLASREHQRLKDIAGYLPVSDALILFSSMVEAVRKRVTDERLLREIANELEMIVCRSPVAATAVASRRLAAQPGDPDDGSDALDADTIDAVAPPSSGAPPDAAPSGDLPAISAAESAENTTNGDSFRDNI